MNKLYFPVLLFFTLLINCWKSSAQSTQFIQYNEAILIQNRSKALANDLEIKPVKDAIIATATPYLSEPIVTVTQKGTDWQKYFFAEDLAKITVNDYISFAGYFYPVAGHETDGTPWVANEALGLNYDVMNKFDGPRLTKMIAVTTWCSKAYWVSNDNAFAKKAADQLRAWFVNSQTAMKPNFECASIVPFDPVNKTGTGWGIIDISGVLPNILAGIEMIRPSGEWTQTDDAAMKKWCYNFANWLQTSQKGLNEGRAQGNNNHGIYYDALLVGIWMYLNTYNGVDYITTAKGYMKYKVTANRIQNQIGNNTLVQDAYGNQKINKYVTGGMHLELSRPNASMYNSFALDGLIMLMNMSQNLGFDLFNWKNTLTDTRSIKSAIEWYFPYIKNELVWTFGDEVKNPFTLGQTSGKFWISALRNADHDYFFNNYILSQIDMYQADKSEQNLYYPRKLYYSDDFVSNLPVKNRNDFRGVWVNNAGELILSNSNTESNIGIPGNVCAHGSYIFNDFEIKTNLKLTTVNANDGAGVLFMGYFKKDVNFEHEQYYYVLLSKTASESGIYKVYNKTGNTQSRQKIAAINFSATQNVVYNLQIKCIAGKASVWINQTNYADNIPLEILSGKTGFIIQNGNAAFLDIEVKRLETTTAVKPINEAKPHLNISYNNIEKTVRIRVPESSLQSHLQVYSIQGVLLKNTKISETDYSFPMEKKGIYLLRLCQGNNVYTQKFIVD